MEYMLINQDEDLAVREPVIVRTHDPLNWTQVLDVTVAIRSKMLELIRFARESVPGELDVPFCSMQPDSGNLGSEFYVNAERFALLKGRFVEIVWDCIHDEFDDELD